MYHHVRVYSNNRDKLGIRLSVTPTLFASQLDALQQAGFHTVTFSDLQKGTLMPAKPLILTFDDGYDNAATAVLPELQKRGMVGVFYIISGKVGMPGYMTFDQLKLLRDAGMELGAHTITHPDLSRLTPLKQQKEIGDSIDYLRTKLNISVWSFAYPVGKYNAASVAIVRKSGMTYAVTTHHGLAHVQRSPLLLKRIRVGSNETGNHLLESIGLAKR